MNSSATDRELLEAAAKAAGVKGKWGREGYIGGSEGFIPDDGRRAWNPLTNDGDALRLAVKLGIEISIRSKSTAAHEWTEGDGGKGPTYSLEFFSKGDPYAATRRAIVRAAASLAATGEKP